MWLKYKKRVQNYEYLENIVSYQEHASTITKVRTFKEMVTESTKDTKWGEKKGNKRNSEAK